MAKTKLRRFYLNKEKVKEDFGSVKYVVYRYNINWKKAYYGCENIDLFNDLPREYILERDTTPKIFVKENVEFVDTEKEATHILKKDNRGGMICKRILA